MKSFYLSLACVVWTLLSTPSLRAQSIDTTLVPLPVQDSAVTAIVTRMIVARLAPEITTAILDTGRAWEITVPVESDAIQWSRIKQALMRALHARPRETADTSYMELSISRTVYRRDSLIIRYFIGRSWKCGEVFKGHGTYYLSANRWVRSMYNGSPLTSAAVGFADSVPCGAR